MEWQEEGIQAMEELLGTIWTQELAEDLYMLDDKLVEFLDFYYDVYQDKHGGIPGWDIVESALFGVMLWFEYPPGSIPDEELYGE